MEKGKAFCPSEGGLTLRLYVQPGASNTGFNGLRLNGTDCRIVLRLRERAHDGLANKALQNFLSDYFDVPKSSISLLSGESARLKTVQIKGEQTKLAEKARLAEL